MEPYARVTWNSAGAPHNQQAWKVTVFDGDAEPLMKLAYDHALLPDIPFETQMLMRLRDLGYDASANDFVYDDGGLRILHIHRIA